MVNYRLKDDSKLGRNILKLCHKSKVMRRVNLYFLRGAIA